MVHRGNVVITGTSTGIGRATAMHLDRLGYRVFATVRKESDAESLQSEASDLLSPVFLDVTEPDTIAGAQQTVSDALGEQGLLGLVNNAGVGFTSPLETVPLDALRRLFEVNVFGLLAVTQAFLPLVRQTHGRIVNVSSEASLIVAPFHGPYSASKLALNGLSDALRQELKPLGVQVSVIITGSVRTPIWDQAGKVTERIVADRAPETLALYSGRSSRLREAFGKMGSSGLEPEAVAHTIARALTARRPKHYYYAGPDARLFRFVSTFVPEPLHDWITSKYLGL